MTIHLLKKIRIGRIQYYDNFFCTMYLMCNSFSDPIPNFLSFANFFYSKNGEKNCWDSSSCCRQLLFSDEKFSKGHVLEKSPQKVHLFLHEVTLVQFTEQDIIKIIELDYSMVKMHYRLTNVNAHYKHQMVVLFAPS